MNTYEKQQARLVEDFINTFDLYLEQPEHLREPADLQRFLERHGIKPEVQINQAVLDEARVLRERLRDCWNAGTVDELTVQLNPLLAEIPITISLANDTDAEHPFHTQYLPQPGTPLLQRLTIDCAAGIIAVLEHYGMDRMRACAASPCQDVFIDTSRNKSRRFCSERCANRYNIAAFRERHKETDDE